MASPRLPSIPTPGAALFGAMVLAAARVPARTTASTPAGGGGDLRLSARPWVAWPRRIP